MKLHQVQLLARVPIILKDLYDADLLEEDVILSWAEKVCEGLRVKLNTRYRTKTHNYGPVLHI